MGWRFRQAKWSGVAWSRSPSVTLAPWLSKSRTATSWPTLAARCRGVCPARDSAGPTATAAVRPGVRGKGACVPLPRHAIVVPHRRAAWCWVTSPHTAAAARPRCVPRTRPTALAAPVRAGWTVEVRGAGEAAVRTSKTTRGPQLRRTMWSGTSPLSSSTSFTAAGRSCTSRAASSTLPPPAWTYSSDVMTPTVDRSAAGRTCSPATRLEGTHTRGLSQGQAHRSAPQKHLAKTSAERVRL